MLYSVGTDNPKTKSNDSPGGYSSIMIHIVLLFLFLASFCTCDECLYMIFLENSGTEDLGWSANSLTAAKNGSNVFENYSGGFHDAILAPSDLLSFTYNLSNPSTSPVNIIGVSLYDIPVYSTLPSISHIPNQCYYFGSCLMTVKAHNTGSTSWSNANFGIVIINGVEQTDNYISSTTPTTFSINPKDKIEFQRPFNFLEGMSVEFTLDVTAFYSMSSSASGPTVYPFYNLCPYTQSKLLAKQLPQLIEPKSIIQVSTVLPVSTPSPPPINVKYLILCGGGQRNFAFSSTTFDDFNTVATKVLPNGLYGDCEVSAVSLFGGLNPFQPSQIQTVIIKYTITFSSIPLAVPMDHPIKIVIAAPVGIPDASTQVSLSCSGGWLQTWDSIRFNTIQYLELASTPMPANSECTIKTLLDSELYINEEASMFTPNGPADLIPTNFDQISELTKSLFIPPSELPNGSDI